MHDALQAAALLLVHRAERCARPKAGDRAAIDRRDIAERDSAIHQTSTAEVATDAVDVAAQLVSAAPQAKHAGCAKQHTTRSHHDHEPISTAPHAEHCIETGRAAHTRCTSGM